ncbi:hypothetical protein ACQPWY_29060 [Pseudonocardia xinjiangensis]|uniref:hypothetical protein n=1 Tax=Pseudonocardia xinjiangensis TaxID=75289 RepID=UPI003D8CC7FC
MTAAPTRTGTPTPVPATVRLSVLLWLTAITAGAAEVLVRLLLPEPPTPAQLWARFAIYTALAVLVLALHTGRGAVRWAVAVLLGGIGTLSLVVEPATWLLAGGSPTAFLATADGPTLLVTGLRVAHIAAVLVALTFLFRPTASEFFRRH